MEYQELEKHLDNFREVQKMVRKSVIELEDSMKKNGRYTYDDDRDSLLLSYKNLSVLSRLALSRQYDCEPI